MSKPIILFSDLDRTLIPNGRQAESPQARPLLRKLAARPEVTLVYVSGRHERLLRQAIKDYELPTPAFAIGDVGTTMYEIKNGQWHPWEAWSHEIAPDWQGLNHEQLAEVLSGVDTLRLQEPEKQNRFKLSYYAPANADRNADTDSGTRRHADTDCNGHADGYPDAQRQGTRCGTHPPASESLGDP